MWGFLRVRWVPFAALGAIVALVGAFGSGYMKGSSAKDTEWELKWERQQGAFMQAQAERQNRALQAMADRHRAQARVARQLNEIAIPDTATCTDPDWLLAHNRAVQAANGP